MKYNPDKIRRLSSELFNALGRLKELADLQKEEFLKDAHRVASAKYHLLIAIEAHADGSYLAQSQHLQYAQN